MPQNKKKTNQGSRRQNSASKPAKVMNSPARKVAVKKNNSKTQVVLSQCAIDYARCTANPFNGPLGCVPNSPSVMSKSVRTFIKGEFRTGTGGIGYISFDPDNMVANDAGGVFYTTAASTSSTIGTFPLNPGDVVALSNSEYPLASYNTTATGNSYRLVAAALRIRYIGTELNRGGTIIAFVDPTNADTVGRSAQSLLGEECSRKFPVSRVWTTIHWRPVLAADYLFATLGPAGAEAPMCFMVESPSLVVSVFEFEATCVFEINGRNVRGMRNTHVDTVAFNGTQQITQTDKNLQPSQVAVEEKEKGIINKLASYIKEGASHIEKVEEMVGDSAKIIGSVIKVGQLLA